MGMGRINSPPETCAAGWIENRFAPASCVRTGSPVGSQLTWRSAPHLRWRRPSSFPVQPTQRPPPDPALHLRPAITPIEPRQVQIHEKNAVNVKEWGSKFGTSKGDIMASEMSKVSVGLVTLEQMKKNKVCPSLLGPPIWSARALSRVQVDGCVPRTKHVDSRNVTTEAELPRKILGLTGRLHTILRPDGAHIGRS